MGGCKNKRIGRCQAKTAEGKRCGNCAKVKYCHIHTTANAKNYLTISPRKRSLSPSYVSLGGSRSPSYVSLRGSRSSSKYLHVSPHKRSSGKRRSASKPRLMKKITPISYRSHSSSGGFYPTRSEIEHYRLTGSLPNRAKRVIF